MEHQLQQELKTETLICRMIDFFFFLYIVSCGMQVAISEHDPNSENDTGIIIQDITNTVDDATDELLTLVHTSGSNGYE